MKKKNVRATAILSCLILFAVLMAGIASAEVVSEPTVSKTVAPEDINIAGSGVNEETTIEISVTGSGSEWTTPVPMDVVFALDSSGSMTGNDPSGLRKTAAKNFVDKMNYTTDQAGVVSWDDNIDFTYALTDQFTSVKTQIDNVDSSGGTNLNIGLNSAIGLLDSGKQSDASWVIIFLTDGDGTYTYSGNTGSPADDAANKGYVIYSIGLGSSPATGPLQDMADATGGTYYPSPSASNLDAIFNDIYNEITTSTIPHYVDVVEVTQSYIIDEGSFSPSPDSVTTDGSGLTTIVWNNIGNIYDGDPDMSSDETVTLSFTAKSNQNGAGLGVDVVPTAKVNFKDKDGNPAGSVEIPQAYLNVNAPPVADANGPYEALEGTIITLDGSGSYDPDGDTLTYAWDLDDDGQYDDATGVTTTVDCPDDDSYTVGLEVSDGVLKNTDTATVTVNNVAPTVTATGDMIDEDGTATVSGEITDPGALDTFTVEIDWGEGVPESFSYPAGTTSYSETHQYLDDNPTATPTDDYIVVVTVTDDDGGVGSADTTVTVNNVAPEITSLTLPEDPVDISNPVDLNAEFTDIGTEDTHYATISWGDGNFDILSDATSPIIESHTYALPGVYTITLTVMDDDIGSDSEVFMYVVVYDPNDGFVTGGGWINSPEGAYVPDPDLTGKATFGFVSKYKKGASEPTGNTEFQFHAAGLNFHSSSYDWLVIAGHKAKYKGTGTINGEGNYGFMISAIDEKLTPSTDVDKFRIKIWDKDNADTIVYDNQMGDADDADATTEIQSGNIVIHKSKTQPEPTPQFE